MDRNDKRVRKLLTQLTERQTACAYSYISASEETFGWCYGVGHYGSLVASSEVRDVVVVELRIWGRRVAVELVTGSHLVHCL